MYASSTHAIVRPRNRLRHIWEPSQHHSRVHRTPSLFVYSLKILSRSVHASCLFVLGITSKNAGRLPLFAFRSISLSHTLSSSLSHTSIIIQTAWNVLLYDPISLPLTPRRGINAHFGRDLDPSCSCLLFLCDINLQGLRGSSHGAINDISNSTRDPLNVANACLHDTMRIAWVRCALQFLLRSLHGLLIGHGSFIKSYFEGLYPHRC